MPRRAAAVLLALGLCAPLSGCRTASQVLRRAQDALPEAVSAAEDQISEVLSGLSRSIDLDRQGFSLQQTVDDFFAAVDSRDAEGIKALFAPSALAEAPDMDAQIEALFAAYPGPTDECFVTRTPGGSGHYGFMEKAFTVSAWVPVVSGEARYYCAVSLTTQDQANPDNLGLRRLVFVSEKARCSEDFTCPDTPGLTVLADAPGDYLTCRIGDEPFRYTPADRTVTAEEIAAFCAADDSWDAFTARFGAPNAVTFALTDTMRTVAYELPDEDGEKRYALVHTHQTESGGWRVWEVSLKDGRHYQSLGVLWCAEEDAD